MADTPDWLRLQKKIFTRWVNQKLSKKLISSDDVVQGVKDGLLLIALLEVLSEKTFTEKIDKKPKMRAQLLDNANLALKFVWSCGVEMKIKPSAEDVVDGNEKQILGLIWAIMLKYIKIGDDEEEQQLNVKDSLLMWVKNKTAGYSNVSVDNFGKSFHDGLALCAIIHKHRPKLINWESLAPENKIQNLQTAIDAAEKYFGLEKYLTPEDIPKLDENSMVIYVSDYYYGIAEQRKLDLAARRIGKVIKFTKENDARRAEYKEKSEKIRVQIDKCKTLLEDKTVHNTMAGAKKRLEEFYAYKGKDKNEIIEVFLILENIFGSLERRLKARKRPDFVPPAGHNVSEFSADIKHLEQCEKEQNVALHAELNRQIKLVKLDDQHKSIFAKLQAWIAEKEAYLKKKEIINSVSGAQLHLKLLDAYEQESKTVHETSIAELKKLGAELNSEKYERVSEVQARESEVDAASTTLSGLAQGKRPVLDDDLAREIFKEKVRILNLQHTDKHAQLVAWIAEKEAYLKKKETVNSISEAQTQIGLLDSYEKEKASASENKVAPHKSLGENILAQKYETQYSSYVWENPGEIKERIDFVASKWEELSGLSAEKKNVLDDDLARELFKEKVRQMDHSHSDLHARLSSWIADKEAYLTKVEEIDSIAEAQTALSLLEVYDQDKKSATETSFTEHQKLGEDILGQKYETKYSSYVWEKPDEINSRLSTATSKWANLDVLAAEKKKKLDAALALEIEKERLRLEFAHLAAEFVRWTKDTAEKIGISSFGFNLDEVEAYQAILDKDNAALTNQANSSLGAAVDVHSKMTGLGVKVNVYTNLTPDDLKNNDADLNKAIEARNVAYATELQRQRENDALCKQFADLANPLSSNIASTKAEVEASSKSLEEQLQFVTEKISGQPKDGENLPSIKELDGQIKAKGITQNRHSTLTSQDVEVQWDQYKLFLEKKKSLLEEEIEHKNLRGISPEDFQEIEDNFKQFDYDKSGNIDKKELKACLYSLGEEKSKSEIEAILSEYGNPQGKIGYERFKDFMIKIYGDTDTKEEIFNGFKLINRGAEVAKVDKMEIVMDENDLKYITETAPKVEGGYDYNAWVEDVFSR